MRLNLGCGLNPLDGFVNVDKAVASTWRGTRMPDVVHDLETFPWPWADRSVREVVLNHVLEHLGREPDVFMRIMQELYRVCAHGAEVQINVPHPRHDHFIGDPTHVRVVTPAVLALFSRASCLKWAKARAANSPLALYANVDFEMIEQRHILDGPWAAMFDKGLISAIKLDEAMRKYNNVVKEIRMTLRVVKPEPVETVPPVVAEADLPVWTAEDAATAAAVRRALDNFDPLGPDPARVPA